MKGLTAATKEDSPFHAGELDLQKHTGNLESVRSFASKAIRAWLPDQHRAFFEQLPFVVLGSVDEQGWPWASILAGHAGFMHSPNRTQLTISARTQPGDPLTSSLVNGGRLGLLGIDPTTRRRNRVNARVRESSSDSFLLDVDQSFGNCPQYIQRRSVDFVRKPGTTSPELTIEHLDVLDKAAQALIESADTLFVSSHVPVTDRPEKEGVDVSHRGGQPGFVKVDGNTLTIPDYPGNNLFNTLGNFLINPKAGLLFVDFTTGDTLQLCGTVEILWESDATVQAFQGAERGWRFHLHRGLRVRDSLPFRSNFIDYSPNSLLTGTWAQAEAALSAEAQRPTWQTLRVARLVDESTLIRSLYLEADDHGSLIPSRAGQHVLIRVTPENGATPLIRSYTLSSAPGDKHYRISVKKERHGIVSSYLHERISPGDLLEIKAPAGDFWIDPTEKRPAVLLAAGVGITPMIAMARHVADHALLTRHARHLTILHACRTSEQRAFAHELAQLQRGDAVQLDYYRIVSQPTAGDVSGQYADLEGRIDAAMLRSVLPLDDYDFFLCGPPGFMQTLYDELRKLGVPDQRIQAEAFGPSSLSRSSTRQGSSVTTDIGNPSRSSSVSFAAQHPPTEEAEASIVHFVDSGIEQRWNHGDPSLLELAEAQGLTPEYGCRQGSCGRCAARLISGQVTYRNPPTAIVAGEEVLICCAVPAKGEKQVSLAL